MTITKNLAWILMFSVFALPLSAFSQTKTVKWKEEVRLTNGQNIVVERSQEYRSVYSGGSLRPGWLFDYERIRAVLPPPHGEIAWEGRLKPLALDIASSGSIYVVAVVATVAGQKEYELPDGSFHVAFNYGGGKWRRIPIGAVPQEFRPNMLAGTWTLFIGERSTVEFVDFALKKRVDSDPRMSKRYRGWPEK